MCKRLKGQTSLDSINSESSRNRSHMARAKLPRNAAPLRPVAAVVGRVRNNAAYFGQWKVNHFAAQ